MHFESKEQKKNSNTIKNMMHIKMKNFSNLAFTNNLYYSPSLQDFAR